MENMGNLKPSPLEGDAVAARPLTPELALLRSQYEEPHYLELENGERLKYTVVKPTHETKQTEWIMIVGGFSSTKEMWREEIIALAKSGKRVVFATPDRGIYPDKTQALYFEGEGKTIPQTIQNKTVAIKKLLDHLGISKTNLLGQSQGGAVATSLAEMYPGLVKKLVLDSPAGIAKQPLPVFLARSGIDAAIMKLKSILAKRREKNSGKELDPVTAALDKAQWDEYERKLKKYKRTKEILDIGRVDILPILERMQEKKKEEGEGPEIWLVNANSDLVFPARKIDKALGTNKGSPFKYVDRQMNYLERDAQHGKYENPSTNEEKQARIVSRRQNKAELMVQMFDERKIEEKAESQTERKTA